MAYCVWSQYDYGGRQILICDFCKTICKVDVTPEAGPKRKCGLTPYVKGPGDHLHDALLKLVGEGPTRSCQCTDRIAQMNRWGPACVDHLEEIVDWLMAEASKRGWWRVACILPGSRLVVRQIVLGAIRRAETPPA